MDLAYFLISISASALSTVSDEIKGALITTLITGIISIVGFIITYASMKKSFTNELKKQRDSVALEKMATMPFDVLTLLDEIINSAKTNTNGVNCSMNTTLNHFTEIMNKIYSYGSQDAITIVATIQKENYATRENTNQFDQYRMISLFILLANQIKYDVTEIAVCPKLWFEMRMTDYTTNKAQFINANNIIVQELKLNKKFLITN